MSKLQKNVEPKKDEEVELESQFILRLLGESAKALRNALESDNLKDRLLIKVEQNNRYGLVQFDNFVLYAKIVDLPTAIESLKTFDNKSFYKTADICQIMICSEEPDLLDDEDESPNKEKKKDSIKVDKKFLWPHGVTPPCKNIRKRRFRKTLKKKYVVAPKIQQEIKRLLRIDNEAEDVTYEIINEDEINYDEINDDEIIDYEINDDEINDDEINDDEINDDEINDDENNDDEINDDDINDYDENVESEVNDEDYDSLKNDQYYNLFKQVSLNETDEEKFDDSVSSEQTNKIYNKIINSDGEQGKAKCSSNLIGHDIHDIFGGEVSSDDDSNHNYQDRTEGSQLSKYLMKCDDEQKKYLTEFNISMLDDDDI